MYQPVIELLMTDIQHQIAKQQDEEIYKAVLHFVPNVDKEELMRALNYDRQQYEKGYLDGKADAAEARPIDEWDEDMGDVLWWKFPIEEAPYVGSPLDAAWPGYHTHWTPIPIPKEVERWT